MTAARAKALSAGSPNFGFLEGYDLRLIQAAMAAERQVFEDPVGALMRLRQFGELLAEQSMAYVGLYASDCSGQLERLRRLADRRVLTSDVADLFHDLRRKGNAANHESIGSRRDALHQLRMARVLAVWFHRTFGNQVEFKAGPFVPPPNPGEEDRLLETELERLRAELTEAHARAQSLSTTAEHEATLRQQAEDAAAVAYQDLEAALELAQESEEQAALATSQSHQALQFIQTEAQAAPPSEVNAIVERAQAAGEQLDLDEAATRTLIDAQLNEAGWEADTEALTFKRGIRPIKGRNLAIAEWPTSSGPADYVLFIGLVAVAVVEAKRKRIDVAGAIDQSKRYSRDYVIKSDETLAGGPWGEYKIPFLFATNGRAFLRQIETKSGIWFLDARRATNHPHALEGWYSPEGLEALATQDHEDAEARLRTEPTDYLGLRDYQLDAIRAIEAGIAKGRTELLVAMATGTGKTRTALGLMYRLVKSRRFRRVLFLVDRTSLGEQALGAFTNVKLENLQSFDEIYDIKGLEDIVPEKDTRLQVATIQGMVKRLLYPSESDEPISVDRYDCIIVDESHRGYTLDREMGEGELRYRSQLDYVSKYRRVIDHFDAVRIGLTATPALHTTEIFGAPIYSYGYRQAVIDGYLVDHEPPIRILTELNQQGIHWKVGEPVSVYHTETGQVDLFDAPDEIDIEIEGFNTKVVTEAFNRVVATELAQHIDPSLPGKTLVFCATDNHADLVVTLLKNAFTEAYGEVDDNAVTKITGAADKPLEKIRRYKNEALPSVAVTVDLLTTGIDVPEIVNLVFLRRVRSRILYEQMMGRATRLCPKIGKELFRIYDPVDLYAAIDDYSTMKPVVTLPRLGFSQLVEELLRVDDDPHCRSVIDNLLVKLHRRRNRITGEIDQDFQTSAGRELSDLVELLKNGDVSTVRRYFAEHPTLAPFLDKLKPLDGQGIFISDHDDELIGTERGYGDATRPEDYLAGFKAWIQENSNRIPALLIVTQRPRELTRKQLRELRMALDQAGFSIANLRTAWHEATNEDIAASIIGHIRQQALGAPLLDYDDRVKAALTKVLASRSWTNPQRQWLERIGKQMSQELIVDRAALDRGQFAAQGGFARLDKIFKGQLTTVLTDLHTELWQDSA